MTQHERRCAEGSSTCARISVCRPKPRSFRQSPRRRMANARGSGVLHGYSLWLPCQFDVSDSATPFDAKFHPGWLGSLSFLKNTNAVSHLELGWFALIEQAGNGNNGKLGKGRVPKRG